MTDVFVVTIVNATTDNVEIENYVFTDEMSARIKMDDEWKYAFNLKGVDQDDCWIERHSEIFDVRFEEDETAYICGEIKKVSVCA